MSYQVIGIGNALVDIQVQVSDELLEKQDLKKGGMMLMEDKDQRNLLFELQDKSHTICSGGSAANTIHGLGSLGARTYYIGRVADDKYGQHYTRDMQDCGVGFPGPDAISEGTGTSVILITEDAQRTMITHLGISSSLSPENVDTTLIKDAKYIYIEGYLFTGESTRAALMKIAEEAKRHGVPVAFTLSDAFVVESFRQDILEFLQWSVDILFCNEIEMTSLVGEKDFEKAFDKIRGFCNTVFVTRGEHGAWYSSRGSEQGSVKSFPVEAVDTTGAGDLFAAGALYGLLHKHDLKECAILGSYMASEVITHLGARMPSHSHKNVEKILTLYNEIK